MPSTLPTFDDIRDQGIVVALNVIKTVAVLIIALLFASVIKKLILRLAGKRFSINLATLLGNLARVGILTVGGLVILSIFGVDGTGLLTLVSAMGLALSLALQDVLRNFVAGIYILLERPFRIGDTIFIKDMNGVVQGVELRTTLLRTEEGTQVIVPNSVIFNEIMVNRSAYNLQQDQVEIAAPLLPLEEALTRIRKVVDSFPQIECNPSAQTSVEAVSNDRVHLRVTYWTAPSVNVGQQVVSAIREEFPGAEIVLK